MPTPVPLSDHVNFSIKLRTSKIQKSVVTGCIAGRGGDEQRKGEKRRMEGSGRGTREEKGKGGVERESDSRTSKQENFAD